MTGAGLVLVRGVVGERQVRAELLEPGLAFGTGAVGVDQAADRGEVARLELVTAGADLRDPPDDLVARHEGVDRGHEVCPLVADRVEVGVADAAEEDLDLHVALGRVAPRDRGRPSGDVRTGCGVGFRLVHKSPPYALVSQRGAIAWLGMIETVILFDSLNR